MKTNSQQGLILTEPVPILKSIIVKIEVRIYRLIQKVQKLSFQATDRNLNSPSKHPLSSQQGLILTEVLITGAILGVLVGSIFSLFTAATTSVQLSDIQLKNAYLAQEQLEILRSIKVEDWDSLTAGRYYPSRSGDSWALVATTSSQTIGSHQRYIEIEDIQRDQSGDIVQSGGNTDPSTKKVISNVTKTGSSNSFKTTSLLTRLENDIWLQTTQAEFDAGVLELVRTTQTDDGEVELAGGCPSGSPEALIYDDQLRNGWRVNCSGLPFWQWLICLFLTFFDNADIDLSSTDYTHGGSQYSMKITLHPPHSGSFWSWIGIRNYNGVCTTGFENIHFQAYNPSPFDISFNFTAVYSHWNNTVVDLPPGGWTEIYLNYEDVRETYEDNLEAVYFSKFMSSSDSDLVFYIDQLELTGGIGGYFTTGSLTSSTFDASKPTSFNRVEFTAQQPPNTSVGFQFAISNDVNGPFVFYGPGGTTAVSDLYTDPLGEGIWLGNNFGQFAKYKAYLESADGVSTPILEDVSINYAP